MNASIRRRISSSGSLPTPAPMLSRMGSGFEVAGMARVTARWEAMYLRKNWAHEVQSNSDAHAGSSRPRVAWKRFPPGKGPGRDDPDAALPRHGKDALARGPLRQAVVDLHEVEAPIVKDGLQRVAVHFHVHTLCPCR